MTQPPPTCDIIIPTFNNERVLPATLAALFAQRGEAEWKIGIIISDDGSSDGTVAFLKGLQAQSPWPVRILQNPHRGAAAARNRALETSSAHLILFLGADIILRPGALAAHLDFHTQWPDPQYAALGHVAWDPRIVPTPLMSWLTHGGPQNDFDALLGQAQADPAHYFYGSHLSLKRSALTGEPWSEAFGSYGWEDLELGRRLANQGLILKPYFIAQALHHHRYTLADVGRRQRAAGQAVRTYQALHPEVPLLPPVTWKTYLKFFSLSLSGALVALGLFLRYSEKRWSTPHLFFAFASVEYWRGVLSAQRR